MNFKQNNKIKVEGGMASMTDLVFLLLIFFIIMSLMAQNQTPLDLPESNEKLQTDQTPAEPTVIVKANSKYVVMYENTAMTDTSGVDYNTMVPAIEQAIVKSNKTVIRIAGHKEADYDAVFKVLGLAQSRSWSPLLAYK